jgi:hypothetical protein
MEFHRQPYSFRWGDGSEWTEEEKDSWGRAKEASLRRVEWQKGDLLLLDNLVAMHGRLPFKGDRKMAVMLGDPYERVQPDRGGWRGGMWVDSLKPSTVLWIYRAFS